MIIVWRWKSCIYDKYNDSVSENKIYKLLKSKNNFEVDAGIDRKIIGYTKINDAYFYKKKLKTITPKDYSLEKIEESAIKLSKEEDSKVLVLFHSGYPDNIRENQHSSDFKNNKNKNLKYSFFSGEDRIIYNNLLDENRSDLRNDALENPNDKNKIKIKKDKFESVWNYYYVGLEQKKNDLIKLWLPLAIDIQGLSEVFQKREQDKAKKYWGEIKGSTESFNNLWIDHNNIAEDNNELKLYESKETKLKDFLKDLDSTNKDKLPDDKYLNPNSNSFFPKWLEKYI